MGLDAESFFDEVTTALAVEVIVIPAVILVVVAIAVRICGTRHRLVVRRGALAFLVVGHIKLDRVIIIVWHFFAS